MTKHTPGPWKWVGDNYLDGPSRETVLECRDDGKPWGLHSARLLGGEADRTLIAAAPDLYEACKAAMEGNPRWPTLIHEAVRKAEGNQA